MGVNYTPQQHGYKEMGSFRFWCQKVLPTAYDDSLSYSELLNKVVGILNDVIENHNNMSVDITSIYDAYIQLQEWVNAYFDNLSVQSEVDHKLDLMVNDGTFTQVLQPLVDVAEGNLLNLFNEQKTAIDTVIANHNTTMQQHTEKMAQHTQELSENHEAQNEKINLLERRMDTFTSLPEGSTTGDAEIIDARIGYDGVRYTNLGEAIRGQAFMNQHRINENEKLMMDVTDGYDEVETGEVINGFIDQWGSLLGESDGSRGHIVCENVSPGDVYHITTFLRPTTISAVVFFLGIQPVATEKPGTGENEVVELHEIVVPLGCDRFVVNTANKEYPIAVYQYKTIKTPKFYTKEQTDELIDENDNKNIQRIEVLTERVAETESVVINVTEGWVPIGLNISTTSGYYNKYGGHSNETGRPCAELSVNPGEVYRLDSYIRSTAIPAIVMFNGDTFVAYDKLGTGEDEYITGYEIVIPNNCNRLVVQSAHPNRPPVLYTYEVKKTPNFYSKEESNEMHKEFNNKFGVRWSVNNNNDLGERCFGAIGLNAEIGIGTTNGHSDFDSIYPWCDMKRCNIITNENGSNIVTYEGENGFALDGTNGDVFVRIPKFNVKKYTDSGYEYVVIGDPYAPVHEAFIENGKVLDEIFVSAFEGKVDSNGRMKSVAGVIPSSNMVAKDYLNAAKANGVNYSLYDNRCVDALWCLMSVEYGCRNSNAIIGYGLADFMQPVVDYDYLCVKENANGTNSVKVGLMDATARALMPIGSNITICDTLQTTVIAQRKLTAIEDTPDGLYSVVHLDGDPVNVTTSCFIGSCAFNTNFCESCESALNWHTGRANWVDGSNTQNPIRYRWVENIVGNLWHYLPDVTFYNYQMYTCKNMCDYEFHKVGGTYLPVGKVLTENNDNGIKTDLTGRNYWITSLVNDTFAKCVPFGKQYDKNLTSKQAFGGYYYLAGDTKCIANGGGFDHLWRCNILTQRAWISPASKWYLYGARLMFKKIV